VSVNRCLSAGWDWYFHLNSVKNVKSMKHYKKIEATILSTARDRGAEKSTCPSEIARTLFPENWRNHMNDVREVAIDLHNKGSVLITQKGMPVDVKHIKGPVRIKIV
jgi:DNA polymerase III delta prime subunit